MKRGLLLYGYNQKDAETIHEHISSILHRPLFLKSASGKENETIEMLLGHSDKSVFIPNETKILLFVNITDEELQQILTLFPSTVKRPIFCGLTEHNILWPFSELKQHLLEEQAYWQKQKQQTRSQG